MSRSLFFIGWLSAVMTSFGTNHVVVNARLRLILALMCSNHSYLLQYKVVHSKHVCVYVCVCRRDSAAAGEQCTALIVTAPSHTYQLF